MKRRALSLVMGAVLGMGSAGAAWASECISFNGVVVSRSGDCNHQMPHAGGEIPIPFGLNSKVELADGEAYLLVGRVVILPRVAGNKEPRVMFEVDLREHPWLANAKRRTDAVYPLEGGVMQWRKFENKAIKLACKAHGRIVNYGYGNEYVISLEGAQPAPSAGRH